MKWIIIVALLLAAVEIPFAAHESMFRMNWTSSVPVGLYHTQSEPSSYLVFCLSSKQLATALQAGMDIGSGECANGYKPLLKTVYQASVQSPITLNANGFTVAGRWLKNTAPKAFSQSGKPLRAYASGTFITGFWVISTYNPDSYDSRYFGPVALESIRFYAHPVLTF